MRRQVLPTALSILDSLTFSWVLLFVLPRFSMCFILAGPERRRGACWAPSSARRGRVSLAALPVSVLAGPLRRAPLASRLINRHTSSTGPKCWVGACASAPGGPIRESGASRLSGAAGALCLRTKTSRARQRTRVVAPEILRPACIRERLSVPPCSSSPQKNGSESRRNRTLWNT